MAIKIRRIKVEDVGTVLGLMEKFGLSNVVVALLLVITFIVIIASIPWAKRLAEKKANAIIRIEEEKLKRRREEETRRERQDVIQNENMRKMTITQQSFSLVMERNTDVVQESTKVSTKMIAAFDTMAASWIDLKEQTVETVRDLKRMVDSHDRDIKSEISHHDRDVSRRDIDHAKEVAIIQNTVKLTLLEQSRRKGAS